MSTQVLRRRVPLASGSAAVHAAVRGEEGALPPPITFPPEDLETLTKQGDSFIFESFTSADAWELGHLLHARLSHQERPSLISISLPNNLVVFQATAGGLGGFGSGVQADNESWVRRKRASVLRWGRSTWWLHCKFAGDEARFAKTFAMSQEQASGYAIHGGAVPIYVRGVESLVAVVIVSGLKQHEDHGVIVDVVKDNWEPAT